MCSGHVRYLLKKECVRSWKDKTILFGLAVGISVFAFQDHLAESSFQRILDGIGTDSDMIDIQEYRVWLFSEAGLATLEAVRQQRYDIVFSN